MIDREPWIVLVWRANSKMENGAELVEIARFKSPSAAAEFYQRTQVMSEPGVTKEGDILEVRLEFDDGESRVLQRYKDYTGELD